MRTIDKSHLPFSELLPQVNERIAGYRLADREESPRTRVYFIQESGMGSIKIGMSKHARVRLGELQMGFPYDLHLLATIEGAIRVERTVQHLFSHAHIRGEWFRPVDELLEYVKREGEHPDITQAREMEELFEKRRNMRILA